MTRSCAADAAWPKIEALFRPAEEYEGDLGEFRSVLRFYDGRDVASADDWPERRREILDLWHGRMGPWPDLIEGSEIEYLEKEHVETFTRHKVRVEVGRRQRTEGFLLIPDGDGPFPAILTVFYGPENAVGLVEKSRNSIDYGYQMAMRGFASLNIGNPGSYYPNEQEAELQPLSYLAYVAANCHTLMSSLDEVDGDRIGVVGHSFGGKWAMFASCLYEKFACGVWSDPGIIFDESRPNVNYWEPWYIGYQKGTKREPGVPSETNPRTGPYKWLIENGYDLHELHALMAPRPFLVSGGSEDPISRWTALNHSVAANRLLGYENRVAMSSRPTHRVDPEALELTCLFFEHFLGAGW